MFGVWSAQIRSKIPFNPSMNFSLNPLSNSLRPNSYKWKSSFSFFLPNPLSKMGKTSYLFPSKDWRKIPSTFLIEFLSNFLFESISNPFEFLPKFFKTKRKNPFSFSSFHPAQPASLSCDLAILPPARSRCWPNSQPQQHDSRPPSSSPCQAQGPTPFHRRIA